MARTIKLNSVYFLAQQTDTLTMKETGGSNNRVGAAVGWVICSNTWV